MRTIFLFVFALATSPVQAQHPLGLMGMAETFPEDPYANAMGEHLDSLLLYAHGMFASEVEGRSWQAAWVTLIIRDIPGSPYSSAMLTVSAGVEVAPNAGKSFAENELFSTLYILPHNDPIADADMIYKKIMDVIAEERDYWRHTPWDSRPSNRTQ